VDGIEVLRTVKGDARLRTIPVVVVTSSREEKDLVRSYQLGVNSFVVKPVDFVEFTEAVKQLGLYWALINETPPPGIAPEWTAGVSAMMMAMAPVACTAMKAEPVKNEPPSVPNTYA
jgi:DNA-binding NtrC family response regulator